ncbi:UNVERIFIED_CONTAM: hypothetical protein PYX00_009877 [Menopon gallinae]|uniref:RING-type domain-containing protein n=1 Tax=Menopon gallinae TaxID=328185 RepID=A0AAW2HD08_9NEOP
MMVLLYVHDHYEGYIKAKGRRYFIKALIKNENEWTPSDLIIDWRLLTFFSDELNNFINENHKGIGFSDFFKKLEEFLKSSLGECGESHLWIDNPLKAHEHYKYLEHELKGVNEHIKDFNSDNGTITIQSTDPARRVHTALLKITDNYPVEPLKIISHNLPLEGGNFLQTNTDLQSSTTISNFCKSFVNCIKTFQDFWNQISILDTNCWILDPENPTFGDITRKIKISNRISVMLTFNPYACWQIPDIKFIGCQSTVDEFREVLQKNLMNEVWDPQCGVLHNLMNVLEVEFPPKPDIVENELNLIQSGECAICFMVRVAKETPSVICDNDNCLSNYHASCLSKYLLSIPRSNVCFGRVQGKCPNCEEPIFCPVPDKC